MEFNVYVLGLILVLAGVGIISLAVGSWIPFGVGLVLIGLVFPITQN